MWGHITDFLILKVYKKINYKKEGLYYQAVLRGINEIAKSFLVEKMADALGCLGAYLKRRATSVSCTISS